MHEHSCPPAPGPASSPPAQLLYDTSSLLRIALWPRPDAAAAVTAGPNAVLRYVLGTVNRRRSCDNQPGRTQLR
jgi:hypothetical protein